MDTTILHDLRISNSSTIAFILNTIYGYFRYDNHQFSYLYIRSVTSNGYIEFSIPDGHIFWGEVNNHNLILILRELSKCHSLEIIL